MLSGLGSSEHVSFSGSNRRTIFQNGIFGDLIKIRVYGKNKNEQKFQLLLEKNHPPLELPLPPALFAREPFFLFLRCQFF